MEPYKSAITFAGCSFKILVKSQYDIVHMDVSERLKIFLLKNYPVIKSRINFLQML